MDLDKKNEYGIKVAMFIENPKYMGEISDEEAKDLDAKVFSFEYGSEEVGYKLTLHWAINTHEDTIKLAKYSYEGVMSGIAVNHMLSLISTNKTMPQMESLSYAALEKLLRDNPSVEALPANESYTVTFALDAVKLAVKENQEKDKMLQDQSRLALMGEMISMIAHQWRQPLSAISASSFGIQLKANSPKLNFSNSEDRDKFLKFLDETLDKISENTQFLSTTIDDFRTFFQSDKKKQISSLEIPLKRALHIVQASLESKEIEIVSNVETYDEIYMYQNEFMQVILNLIKNAEDVLVQNKVKNPKIEVKIYKENNQYIFELRDNGGGISDDIKEKIFNPYFSTKMERDGTGLGLYMSKVMIEEHHNGKLEVCNVDNGACFKIIINEDEQSEK